MSFFISMDYSDCSTGDSSFGVAAGNFKGGVDPRTTHISPKTLIVVLMVLIFSCQGVVNIHQ